MLVASMSSDQFKSFVDATTSSAGAVFAATCMQPLDLAKLHIQAGIDDDDEDSQKVAARKKRHTNVFSVSYLIYKHEGAAGLLRGLRPKLVQTVMSTFVYFYCYSYLKRLYERHIGRTSNASSLFLTSAAAALNMSVTLPFEVITTRIQTHHYSSSSGESFGVVDTLRSILRESGMGGFWNGFGPSLLLVCNPSLNYTIFERLKLRVQVAQMKKTGSKRLKHLTLAQSFWLGVVAKTIATLITYPMIRCKVLMQAEHATETPVKDSSGETSKKENVGMMALMKQLYNEDGWSGLYTGCDAQVLNTAIKAGLMLMAAEELSKHTRRILYSIASVKK